MTLKGRTAAQYFIRNDDVGALDESLRFFVDTFFERQLPVSYQIIPANLTVEAADFLLEKWRARPDLIEFGQHGLTHSMFVRGRQVWREFGPERNFADQAGAIQEGLDILRTLLRSGPPVRVFTPPQHKYDGSTIRAAAKAGHRVFSGSSYPSRHHQLAYKIGRRLGRSSFRHHGVSYHGYVRPEADIAELSVSVAVDNGGKLLRSANSLEPALEEAARTTPVVGLMFHHALYEKAELKTELAALADALTRRAAAGDERFRLLEELATDASVSGK